MQSQVGKLKMINSLISSLLDENGLSATVLFTDSPQIKNEDKSNIEKLLGKRESLFKELDNFDFDNFVDDLNIANYYFSCNHLDNAIKFYDAALVKNPQSYLALSNKGLCLFRLSRFDDALACYNEALGIYKNLPEVIFMKGRVMLKKKEYDKAINEFYKITKLEPTNTKAKFYLAKSILKSGNKDGAIKILETIIASENHHDSLLLLGKIYFEIGKFSAAWSYLDALLKYSPNFIEGHILMGNTLSHLENPNDAIIHFTKVLEMSPNHLEAHINLGKIHMGLNNPNQALSYFDKVLEISPNHKTVLGYKIDLLQKTEKLDDALNCCQMLLESSNDIEPLLKKGILLYNFDKDNDALNVFNEILSTNESNQTALLFKGKIFMKRGELHEATLAFRSITKIDPFNQSALEDLAEVSFKLGDYEKSLEYYNKLLEQSNMEKWVERKAGLLSILGRYDESALIHTSLVREDNARVRSLEELGRIHYILNNHEKAIEFFDKVLCREPMNSKVILNKSMAYFSSSRYEKAIFCLEQILSDDPFYFHAQYQKARIQKILGNVKQSLDILSRITKSNPDFKIDISQDLVFDDLKDIEIFEKKE